MKRTNLSYK